MESPHTPENWSEAASEYDEKITRFTGLFADALLERLAPTASDEALEVAAGPGTFTVHLAARCRRVLATDYAEGMLDRLRARLVRLGVANVECARMDGQALDVGDGGFDVALCGFGLMLFDDRAAGFRELRRALRPGGRVVVSGWSGPDRFEPFGVFGAAIRQAIPNLPPPPGPPAIFSLADREDFARQMRAAGFVNVEVDTAAHNFESESPEAFWELFSSGAPPVRALMAQIGDSGRSAVRDAWLRLLRERFGDGPVQLSAEATIGVGVAPH